MFLKSVNGPSKLSPMTSFIEIILVDNSLICARLGNILEIALSCLAVGSSCTCSNKLLDVGSSTVDAATAGGVFAATRAAGAFGIPRTVVVGTASCPRSAFKPFSR